MSYCLNNDIKKKLYCKIIVLCVLHVINNLFNTRTETQMLFPNKLITTSP